MWDDKGNSWLDFSSQIVNVNIGHQHPRMVAAIKEQADRLCTIGPTIANDMRSEAARLITELAPGDLDMVFFTNGGAEAIENAMPHGPPATPAATRCCRRTAATTAPPPGAIIAHRRGAALGQRARHPGRGEVLGPYPYRSAFNATSSAEECERALAHLRGTVTAEGPQHIAAILLETVVGTNGILVPPDGYLRGVRELCDEHGIMMICDEVMAGFGRCGEWFAVDHWDVTPDLVTFAKGVNSGYVPLGGVIIKQAIADTFRDRVYQGGLTYSGHPLACASAVASINIFKDEGIVEHARHLGTDIIGPRSRTSPPVTRASATCAASACSGRSSWWPTGRRRHRSTRPRWAR